MPNVFSSVVETQVRMLFPAIYDLEWFPVRTCQMSVDIFITNTLPFMAIFSTQAPGSYGKVMTLPALLPMDFSRPSVKPFILDFHRFDLTD